MLTTYVHITLHIYRSSVRIPVLFVLYNDAIKFLQHKDLSTYLTGFTGESAGAADRSEL